MFAVIESGGKQYRVAEGDLLRLDRLDAAVGKKVSFDRVLMVGEGDGIQVGADAARTSVAAEVVEQGKGRKIVVFKKRRRKNYVRTQGHRQAFTAVRIIKIGAAKAAAKPEAKTESAGADIAQPKKVEAKTKATTKAATTKAATTKAATTKAATTKAATTKAATTKAATTKAATTKAAKPKAGTKE